MERNIFDLCEAGNLREIERCLNEGLCPNILNNEGESLLQVAAANGYFNLVTLLLKYGASIDLPNYYGWTPLMHAARYGHTSTVALLLKMKAKVNVCNKLGVSPLIAAASNGHLSTLTLLVEAGAMVDHMSAVNEMGEGDLSTIMVASLYGHEPIVEYLIENGCAVDSSSPITGLTPLMLAACGGHKNIVAILIERGADVDTKDVCGRTALDLAQIFNQLEAKTYLESLNASKSESSARKINITEAIKNGDISKVRCILEKSKELVNKAESYNGITPLMSASIFGKYDIASILISFGAKIDTQDIEKGWTALMHGVYHRNKDIVQLLLEMGADCNIRAINGYTALDLAEQQDNLDPSVIELLTSKSHEPRISVQSPDFTTRERLLVRERLPSKRSLSQTRVKEWIGGVAQHLQNKMLTRRSAKFSENAPSIEITLTDESANEVFLEQTFSTAECDKGKINEPIMLPPDLYLADLLKEHKVEAITPPFPPISTEYFRSAKETQKKSSDQISEPRVKSLRLPNLLKQYTKKRSPVIASKNEVESTPASEERATLKKNEDNSSASGEKISPQKSAEIESEQTFSEESVASFENCAGDLTILLNQESLQKYVNTFRDQEVDIETFQHLTEMDLKEIGIQNTESQRKLMEVIKKFQSSKC